MHSDPQISLHEIAPPFNSSRGAKIHRYCTDQFIRAELPDKTLRMACIFVITLDKLGGAMQKGRMIKAISILAIGVAAAITAGCATNPLAGTTSQSPATQRDYQVLSGTWQLTRGVVNGKPVPASVTRNTILITDRNTFRFPKGERRRHSPRRALYRQSKYATQRSRLDCRRWTEGWSTNARHLRDHGRDPQTR